MQKSIDEWVTHLESLVCDLESAEDIEDCEPLLDDLGNYLTKLNSGLISTMQERPKEYFRNKMKKLESKFNLRFKEMLPAPLGSQTLSRTFLSRDSPRKRVEKLHSILSLRQSKDPMTSATHTQSSFLPKIIRSMSSEKVVETPIINLKNHKTHIADDLA